MKNGQPNHGPFRSNRSIALLSMLTAAIYFLSNPKPHNFYDYTYRVAGDLLRGSVGFTEKQPSWLNEMVPFEGFYYSVFPLGSVVSMVPAAALGHAGIFTEMPGGLLAAVLAGMCCFFLLKISSRHDISRSRQLLQTFGILVGTFMWTNLTFAGAWQLALGFAIVGEFGAIYFTVYDRRPLLAGIFFAMGFGNRTEILLTAPIFMFLLLRPETHGVDMNDTTEDFGDTAQSSMPSHLSLSAVQVRRIAAFCVVPFILGVSTLAYNYVRFHSFTDFGYARIPGVLEEPWYHSGIFSVSYLSGQAYEMLFRSWERYPTFPYLRPNPFSSTIIWSSPFLLYVFRSKLPRWLQQAYRRLRRRSGEFVRYLPSLYTVFSFRSPDRDKTLKYVSWIAIVILTALLWTHGNSGGWQFGYRYAMVLLPWIYLILLETAPKRITLLEGAAYGFSFAANIYATWLYHWTSYMKP